MITSEAYTKMWLVGNIIINIEGDSNFITCNNGKISLQTIAKLYVTISLQFTLIVLIKQKEQCTRKSHGYNKGQKKQPKHLKRNTIFQQS